MKKRIELPQIPEQEQTSTCPQPSALWPRSNCAHAGRCGGTGLAPAPADPRTHGQLRVLQSLACVGGLGALRQLEQLPEPPTAVLQRQLEFANRPGTHHEEELAGHQRAA